MPAISLIVLNPKHAHPPKISRSLGYTYNGKDLVNTRGARVVDAPHFNPSHFTNEPTLDV